MPSSRTFDVLAFGQRLRTYRMARGLSMRGLGEAVGVSKHAVFLWEAGRTQPTLDNLASLSVVLEFTADQLIFGSEPEHAAPSFR